MQYCQDAVLRDGTSCVLRSPTAADAAEMLDYLRTVCGETDNLLRYPDEVTMTVEQEESFLTRRIRHRASMGISVLREYWGRGLGTTLVPNSPPVA